jgi:hypothetical protein
MGIKMDQRDWEKLSFMAKLHHQGVTLDWPVFNGMVIQNKMSEIEKILQVCKFTNEALNEWINDHNGLASIVAWRKYDYPSEIEKNNWPEAYNFKVACFYNLEQWNVKMLYLVPNLGQ